MPDRPSDFILSGVGTQHLREINHLRRSAERREERAYLALGKAMFDEAQLSSPDESIRLYRFAIQENSCNKAGEFVAKAGRHIERAIQCYGVYQRTEDEGDKAAVVRHVQLALRGVGLRRGLVDTVNKAEARLKHCDADAHDLVLVTIGRITASEAKYLKSTQEMFPDCDTQRQILDMVATQGRKSLEHVLERSASLLSMSSAVLH